MPILERILVMGTTGVGKSYQWLQMAQILRPTGAKFYVVDTDNDIDYMLLTQFPECHENNEGNVKVFPATNWKEYKQARDTIRLLKNSNKLKPNDWCVVDKVNNAWAKVQDYFLEEIYGEDPGEYFLSIRKTLKEHNDISSKGQNKGKTFSSVVMEAVDGWKDWPVINKLYRDFIELYVYQVPCHVYMATDVDKIEKDEKDAGILNLFGGFGYKPAGQKAIGGQMHTVFLLTSGKDHHFIYTAKDRANREYFPREPKTILNDFYYQYLVAKAGWPIPD